MLLYCRFQPFLTFRRIKCPTFIIILSNSLFQSLVLSYQSHYFLASSISFSLHIFMFFYITIIMLTKLVSVTLFHFIFNHLSVSPSWRYLRNTNFFILLLLDNLRLPRPIISITVGKPWLEIPWNTMLILIVPGCSHVISSMVPQPSFSLFQKVLESTIFRLNPFWILLHFTLRTSPTFWIFSKNCAQNFINLTSITRLFTIYYPSHLRGSVVTDWCWYIMIKKHNGNW